MALEWERGRCEDDVFAIRHLLLTSSHELEIRCNPEEKVYGLFYVLKRHGFPISQKVQSEEENER